jgi:PAS domain S-box-containing protein
MDWKHFIEDFLMKIEKSNEAERARLIQSITEILQEKEQIQAERDRYHSYLENASDTIAEMDAQGRIIYTTHNWMRQLGHTPDEVKGYSIFGHLFHPEDAPRAQEFLKKAIDTKKTQTGFEYRIRNKDGEYRWHTANLSPVINDGQEVKTVIAIAHSVHERKLAELRLHERETRYRLLLNTMREAVIMVDNNDVVKYVNPRCCELFGLSEEDILGKKGYECLIIPEDQNIILQKNVQRTKGLIDDYTVRGRKKDGSLIWLRISGAPMRNEENEVIGSVGIMTDITKASLPWKLLCGAKRNIGTSSKTRWREYSNPLWTIDTSA